MTSHRLTVTRAGLDVICNALNVEADGFDALAIGKTFPESTLNVWRRKAAENRALTVRLLEQAEPAA